jgi:hypothetical protein
VVSGESQGVIDHAGLADASRAFEGHDPAPATGHGLNVPVEEARLGLAATKGT